MSDMALELSAQTTKAAAVNVNRLANIIRTVDSVHTAGAAAIAAGIADSGFLSTIWDAAWAARGRADREAVDGETLAAGVGYDASKDEAYNDGLLYARSVISALDEGTSNRLMDIAKEILGEYVMRDIEFCEVYEDERAEDLTEEEQRTVHGYMQGAEYTIKMPPEVSEPTR